MAHFPIQAKDNIPPAEKGKTDRTNIFQIKAGAVKQGTVRGEISELSPQLDVKFAVYVAIVAVKAVETTACPIAVHTVTVRQDRSAPAVAVKRKLAGLVNIGESKTQILCEFNLLAIVIIIEPQELRRTSASDLRRPAVRSAKQRD